MSIVTLSTDIGQQDYIVGALKGQLLSLQPNLTIVDISHYLSQSNFPEAAYITSNTIKYYPAGTVHIVIVNFFETNTDGIVLAEYNNQFIICADNGLLTMIVEDAPITVYKIPIKPSFNFLQSTQQIAKAVANLSNHVAPKNFAEIFVNYNIKLSLKPTTTDNWIRGQIIFIDNFENVVINITKPIFDQHSRGRRFHIVLKRNEVIDEISENYLSVVDSEKLATFNSAGYLEFALNKGNMAGIFGLQGFNEINYKEGKSMQNKLFYSTITIYFDEV